jgi:hypothetical protein
MLYDKFIFVKYARPLRGKFESQPPDKYNAFDKPEKTGG